MKKIIRLTERDLTRLVKRIIKENEESSPQISSISVMNNMLTPSGMDGKNVSVSGVLGAVNCDSTSNTKNEYTVNYHRYDMDLIKEALGDDTNIVVYSLSPGESSLTELHEEPQTEGLTFNFKFEKNKIPNLSDKTLFAVMVEKNGVRLKYDGKNVATKCEGFMLK
jgi:hypothetical protein